MIVGAQGYYEVWSANMSKYKLIGIGIVQPNQLIINFCISILLILLFVQYNNHDP